MILEKAINLSIQVCKSSNPFKSQTHHLVLSVFHLISIILSNTNNIKQERADQGMETSKDMHGGFLIWDTCRTPTLGLYVTFHHINPILMLDHSLFWQQITPLSTQQPLTSLNCVYMYISYTFSVHSLSLFHQPQ